MRARYIGALVCAGISASCTQQVRTGRIGDVSATFTTADYRLITSRPSVVGPPRSILCTEPSPDAIRVLSDSGSLSGAAPNGIKAGVDFKASEAEAELAGRSSALLGLRDGLYRACEAAANGYVGHLGYVFILNRYGQAMVTLFLGQDASSSNVATKQATVGDASDSDKGPTGAGDKNGGAQKKAPTQASPNGAKALFLRQDGAGQPGSMLLFVSDTVAPAAAAPAKKLDPKTPKPGGVSSPNSKGDGTQTNGQKADFSAMQQNFLALSSSPAELAHLAFIACLEEFDPTRAIPTYPDGTSVYNPLLKQNCPSYVAAVFEKLPNALSAAATPTPSGKK